MELASLKSKKNSVEINLRGVIQTVQIIEGAENKILATHNQKHFMEINKIYEQTEQEMIQNFIEEQNSRVACRKNKKELNKILNNQNNDIIEDNKKANNQNHEFRKVLKQVDLTGDKPL